MTEAKACLRCRAVFTHGDFEGYIHAPNCPNAAPAKPEATPMQESAENQVRMACGCPTLSIPRLGITPVHLKTCKEATPSEASEIAYCVQCGAEGPGDCPATLCPRTKAYIRKIAQENANLRAEMQALEPFRKLIEQNDDLRAKLAEKDALIGELVEALGEDAAGRTVPELLRLTAAILFNQGGGPIEDCLEILANRIEAMLAKAKEVKS